MWLALGLSGAAHAVPVGVLNNNPGNLRSTHPERYHNCIGVDERGFMKFKRPIDGVRAMVINLKCYGSKHHIHTVEGVVCRWLSADGSKHTRSDYCKFIRQETGFRSNQRINLQNAKTLEAISRAIAHYENGYQPYTEKLWRRVFPFSYTPR